MPSFLAFETSGHACTVEELRGPIPGELVSFESENAHGWVAITDYGETPEASVAFYVYGTAVRDRED